MVTAEFVTALPAIMLILFLALTVLGVAFDQIRCLDAARAAARSASRGDSPGEVRRIAQRLAPPDATVAISGGPVVTVEVRSPARTIAGLIPAGLDTHASASIPRERPL
ncbi:hypothetical protein BJY21_002827 [Kineosphaera limosa]|uniref:TadE family protein n=1 Tax=Kineosphaera limosa NBRC 100340 TaxID=1184609 RepID=K6X1K3_9MICO|nr:TadE family type IV pilus minor pilin [Kineosphaera limosa]NYE01643.1 hypothetical protein [Kineosphaera limosa]GAB98242.1 hypothetical protein KILIM_116_00060 [Kineosphaera limosa NBRC 100340]